MTKPLVSFCIFTYNQENFVEDALRGAFNQNYDNMEIIISDDCSTDNTLKKIQNIVYNYKGTKKIIINENEKNLGIAENVNKTLYELTHGDIILLAAGDDVSLPERTKTTVEYFDKFPEITSLSFESEQVDENLKPIDNFVCDIRNNNYSILTLNDYLAFKDFIIFSGDSRALKRSVLQQFKPIKIAKSEDIYIFIRSLILGSVCYVRQPLVKRRMHGNNASLKKYDKNEKSLFLKQCFNDIDWAFEKKLLTDYEMKLLKKKIHNISNSFELDHLKPRASKIDLLKYGFLTLKFDFEKLRGK